MSWIMKALTGIKTYWYIFLGFVVTAGLFLIKFLFGQNKRLKREVETAEARIEHAREVEEKRKEHANVFKSRRAEAKAEIKKAGVSKELSDPNDW
jgi:hypothetical protein